MSKKRYFCLLGFFVLMIFAEIYAEKSKIIQVENDRAAYDELQRVLEERDRIKLELDKMRYNQGYDEDLERIKGEVDYKLDDVYTERVVHEKVPPRKEHRKERLEREREENERKQEEKKEKQERDDRISRKEKEKKERDIQKIE